MKKKRPNSQLNRQLFHYAWQQKKTLLTGFVLTGLRTLLQVAGPLLIGYILNNKIHQDMTSQDFRAIFLLLILYLLIYLAGAVFTNLGQIAYEKAANELSFHVRDDVHAHILALPVAYFDHLPAGAIVSRIMNDSKRLKHLAELFLGDMLTSAIMILAMFLMIVAKGTAAAVFLIVLVPPVIWVFQDLRHKSALYTGIVRRATSEINAMINEDVQNMTAIQTFNAETDFKRQFDAVNQKIYDANLEMAKVRAYGGYRAIDALQYIAQIIVVLYFGIGRVGGYYEVSIGMLYVLIDYVTKIFSHISTVTTRFGELEQAYQSLIHIFELFLLEKEEPEKKLWEHPVGDLSFKNVSFSYTKEKVLTDISLEISSGQTVAFVGRTGSGKTTLLNLLLRFYDPDQGQITVDGQDITTLNKASLRQYMAVVLQDPFLFEASLRENIQMNDRHTDEEIGEALKAVGGETLLDRGLDEPIMEKGQNLSQGEKQLIAFARAYIKNPKILVLDEATANIDTETEKCIQKGIEALSHDRTTLIVAHRLSTIRHADCIYCLSKGRIEEKGTHDELMRKKGLYYAMYQEQIKARRLGKHGRT